MENILAEDAFQSCMAILYFMKKKYKKNAAEKKRALFQDLLWKSRRLDAEKKAFFLVEGLYQLHQKNISELDEPGVFNFESLLKEINVTKHYDVGIITIKQEELSGVLIAFGLEADEKEHISHGQYRYWFSEINTDSGESFSVVITMVGRPRNVPCAIATDRLLQHYNVDLLILVGCAAGIEKKVNYGDVVCATGVFDYEHARLQIEVKGGKKKRVELPRNDTYTPERMMSDISYFKPDNLGFNEIFKTYISKLQKTKLLKGYRKTILRYDTGYIAAGEKLIADGSLIDRKLRHEERLLAADQEDSGFVQACTQRDHPIPWLVFRGISDYGYTDKDDDINNNRQFIASLAAGIIAVLFLQHAYRVPTD